MVKKRGAKTRAEQRDILDIEAVLQSSLKPVSPRPEFIQSLHKGLMDNTFPEDDNSDVDLQKAVLFAFLGFSGLVFIFSIWIRLLLLIISTLGMIKAQKQKISPQTFRIDQVQK